MQFVSQGGDLPLKCAKFGEPTVVTLIGSEHPAEGDGRIVSPTQRTYIYGCVEERGLHLTNQRAIDILNLNTTLDKTLCGLKGQSVLLMLRNREVQSTVDGLGFCFCM